MNTTITDEQLIDYISNELEGEKVALIEKAITELPEVKLRLAQLRLLYTEVIDTEDNVVSEQAQQRFNNFLAAERNRETPIRQLSAGKRQQWISIAAVAAGTLLVFALGWRYGKLENTVGQHELAATRSLMLELMSAEKTSQRIEATTVALEAEKADPELINNLGYLLMNDANTNVQLAALSALQRFSEEPLVREQLLKALAKPDDRPEIVRLQLIETLVNLREERVLPYLEELINNQRLPRHLKDAAQMGKFKLI